MISLGMSARASVLIVAVRAVCNKLKILELDKNSAQLIHHVCGAHPYRDVRLSSVLVAVFVSSVSELQRRLNVLHTCNVLGDIHAFGGIERFDLAASCVILKRQSVPIKVTTRVSQIGGTG